MARKENAYETTGSDMKLEYKHHFSGPNAVTEEIVLAMICGNMPRKRKIKIWTASRILEQAGISWNFAEHKDLLHRIDRILRTLEDKGILRRRPQKQTSRNKREEIAFEAIADDSRGSVEPDLPARQVSLRPTNDQ